MRRLIYVSPDSNSPTGGIKVIYQHVQMLRSMGFDAHVMHFAEGFRCDWFPNTAPIISLSQLRSTDIVMVPEIMTQFALTLHEQGITYGMFVQNGYLVLPTADTDTLQRCYRHAVAVLSISDDTSGLLQSVFPDVAAKTIRVTYSVDAAKFTPEPKKMLVTYMPRKLPLHANNVVPWLRLAFPQWQFMALHGMSEDQVAAAMRISAVFLAFSDFEGCPVPPIEAALAGNLVLGYHGWGGREYWREPNFRSVDMGDVRDFVRKFHEVAHFVSQPQAQAQMAPGIERIRHDFSPATERANLALAVERLNALIS